MPSKEGIKNQKQNKINISIYLLVYINKKNKNILLVLKINNNDKRHKLKSSKTGNCVQDDESDTDLVFSCIEELVDSNNKVSYVQYKN